MKLNIGCGNKHMDGYCNVDRAPQCRPDVVAELDGVQWPFEDGSVEEIVAHHILEHMRHFPAVAVEIYRVLKVGGKVDIRVPHPRHDAFLSDPTHVRPIMPTTLDMFSRKSNARYRELGAATTPLAEYLGVDLELKRCDYVLEAKYREAVRRGEMSPQEAGEAIEQLNNVCAEIAMVWEKAS